MSGDKRSQRRLEAGYRCVRLSGHANTEILEKFPRIRMISTVRGKQRKNGNRDCTRASSRSQGLAAMKHVGMNVASESHFFRRIYGVNAGLLIIRGRSGCHSSQNEQDNRLYARCEAGYAGASDSQECKDFTKALLSWRKIDLVMLLRMTTRVCHSRVWSCLASGGSGPWHTLQSLRNYACCRSTPKEACPLRKSEKNEEMRIPHPLTGWKKRFIHRGYYIGHIFYMQQRKLRAV